MPVYNFKIVDYLVTNQGFLFKVLFLNNTSSDNYKFVFVPHALYTSILLTDFYLGRKVSDALVNFLIEALKKDISANEIVVIDGEKELLPVIKTESLLGDKDKVGSHQHISYITADRYSLRDLSVSRYKLKGDRISYRNLYKSFYNRLANRFNTFEGVSLRKFVGKRYNSFQFHIINNYLDAVREYEFSLNKIIELFKSERYYFHSLGIEVVDNSVRFNIKNLSVEESVSELERLILFDLSLLNSLEVADRYRLRNLVINNYMEKSINQKLRELYFSDYVLSTKSLINPLLLMEVLSNSVKNVCKATEIIDSLTQFSKDKRKPLVLNSEQVIGKLKVRQYPALLEKVGGSYKEKVRFLERYYLGQGIKEIVRDLNIFNYQVLSSKDLTRYTSLMFTDVLLRDANHDLMIEHFNILMDRDIASNQLLTLKSPIDSERSIQNDLLLLEQDLLMFRDDKHNLYNFSFIQDGLRDITNEFSLVNKIDGIKQILRDLVYGKGLASERVKNFLVFIGREVSSNKNLKPLTLDEIMRGRYLNSKELGVISPLQGDKAQKDLYLVDLLNSLKNEKHLELSQGIFADRNVKDLIISLLNQGTKNRKSLVLDKVIGSQKIRERSVHVYDQLLTYVISGGYYERLLLEGIILEDMYFGNREVSFSDILFEIIGQKYSEGFVLDEQYISEVEERITVLEESGLLSRNDENGGLLTFNIEAIKEIYNMYYDDFVSLGLLPEKKATEDNDNEQGEIVFRDVELVIENPYGYIEKNSLINEDGLQGDIFKLGLVDVDYQLSELITRVGYFEEGNLASHESRGGSIDTELFNSIKDIISSDNLTEEYLAEIIKSSGLINVDMFEGSKLLDSGSVEHSEELLADLTQRELIGGITITAERTLSEASFSDGGKLYNLETILGDRNTLGSEFTKSVLGQLDNKELVNIENIIAERKESDGSVNESNLEEGGLLDEEGLLEEEFTEDGFIEKFSNILGNFIFMRSDDKRFELLKDFVGILPEKYSVVLKDYLLSKEKERLLHSLEESIIAKKFSEGLLKDEIVANKLEEGFIDTLNNVGQGFVYLYDKDVLFEDNNLEKWTVGYGIPADYDPTDPLNHYYSWSDVKDYYQLIHEEWVQFDEDETDKGEWIKEESKFWFKSVGNQEKLSGLYRNVFDSSDYVFTFDFLVEDEPEYAVGTIFKFIDENNYYRFKIYGDTILNKVSMLLEKVENGKVISYGTPMNPFSFVSNRVYKVKVMVYDGRIRIWVNGILQYDFTE